MRETGILDKFEHKYFGLLKENVCGPDLEAAQYVLGTGDVWPIFVVLAAGIAISSIVLTMEYFAYDTKELLSYSINAIRNIHWNILSMMELNFPALLTDWPLGDFNVILKK